MIHLFIHYCCVNYLRMNIIFLIPIRNQRISEIFAKNKNNSHFRFVTYAHQVFWFQFQFLFFVLALFNSIAIWIIQFHFVFNLIVIAKSLIGEITRYFLFNKEIKKYLTSSLLYKYTNRNRIRTHSMILVILLLL